MRATQIIQNNKIKRAKKSPENEIERMFWKKTVQLKFCIKTKVYNNFFKIRLSAILKKISWQNVENLVQNSNAFQIQMQISLRKY